MRRIFQIKDLFFQRVYLVLPQHPKNIKRLKARISNAYSDPVIATVTVARTIRISDPARRSAAMLEKVQKR